MEMVKRGGLLLAAIFLLLPASAFAQQTKIGFVNVARLITFLAHLPLSVAGTTVNRFCGSSMQSVHMAAGAIAMGAEIAICLNISTPNTSSATGKPVM